MTSTTRHSGVRSEMFGEQLVGATLGGKYRLDSLLGRGSTGVVYRANHIELERTVAIKVLNPAMMDSVTAVERFKREARAASRLDHPNAMRALDFGEDARGLLYIVFELIEGADLFDVLGREGSFSMARATSIMAQVLAAVGRAHDLGVIHRDLKPENIMLQLRLCPDGRIEEVVKVCDFGIAQLSPLGLAPGTGGPPQLTSTGLLVGTPHYMSPEQARAEPLDRRTDIYSAGVLLFHLLTGRLPFENDSPLAVAVMQCSSIPPRPSSFAHVSPALEAVCLRAMSKEREARYQSAGEMRDALLAAAASAPSERQASAALRHEASGAFLRSARETDPGSATLPTPGGPELAAIGARRISRLGWLAVAIVATALSIAWFGRRVPAASNPAVVTNAPSAPVASRALQPAPQAVNPGESSSELAEESALPRAVSAPALAPLPAAAPSLAPVRRSPPIGSSRELKLKPMPALAPRDEVVSEKLELAHAELPAAPPVEELPDAPPAAASASVERSPSEVAESTPAAIEPMLHLDPPREAQEVPSAATPARAPEPIAVAPRPAPPVVAREPSLSLSVVTTTAGVSKASVRNAFSHKAFALCYREAWLARALPASLAHLQLEIATDDAGRVSAASVRGEGVPEGLRRCIEAAARSARVREVDTGRASATIDLTLSETRAEASALSD